MSDKTSVLESITAESILAERAKKQKILEELEKLKLELEHSETSEEDEILKEFTSKTRLFRTSVDSCDVNFAFKDYGHTIFYFGGSVTNKGENDLSQMDEEDQYFFLELLSQQLWSKISRYFSNRPYNIGKLCFMLMTTSSDHADACKQYLLSDSNSWVPSFSDIINTFYRWGASPYFLKIMDVNDCEMDCNESTGSSAGTSATESTVNMNDSAYSFEISDKKIELIHTTLDYLSVCLQRPTMTPNDIMSLVTLLLKIGTDKNCSKVLHVIGSLVGVLLSTLPSFDDRTAISVAKNIKSFETNTVNKVVICLSVIPKSERGQLLATYLSFFIILDILGIDPVEDFELRNLHPVIDIFHNHKGKVKNLSPANIYFSILSLTNIIYGLNIKNLDTTELSDFLEYISFVKKLPQIQVPDSNLTLISNVVEWCITFWKFSLDEEKELKILESPRKSPKKSPRKTTRPTLH